MSLATGLMFLASCITVNIFRCPQRFRAAFGHPGGTFLIFMGICLACAFCLASAAGNQDKTLGGDRALLAATRPAGQSARSRPAAS
jgi:hypothetical protein